jgi:hypothetical protein
VPERELRVLVIPRWMALFVSTMLLGREHDACGPFYVRAFSLLWENEAREKAEVMYATYQPIFEYF